MKSFALSLLLVFTLVAHAGQFNVALNRPASIVYTGTPPDILHAQASILVDGNVNNWVTIETKTAGTDNTGTFMTISLGNTFPLTRFKINEPFGQVRFTARVRGFQIQTSLDSLIWTNVIDVPTNSISIPDTTLASAVNASYVRLVITKVPEATDPNPTLISEFEVYAKVDYPIVGSVVISESSSRGKGFQDVTWTSLNMTKNDLVNLYSKPADGSGSYVPLSLNEPNDSLFSWRTDTIPDGQYLIRVAPATPGQYIAAEGKGSVVNFKNLILSGGKIRRLKYYDEGHPDPSPLDLTETGPPPFLSSFFQDSVRLVWNFSIPESGEISYSIDSARTWVHLATIADSSARAYSTPVPNVPRSGMYTFFRVALKHGETIMASAVTSLPSVLSVLPQYVTAQWFRQDPNFSPGTMPSLLSFNLSGKPMVALGEGWILDGNGDSLRGFGSRKLYVQGFCAGDLKNDGTVEFVSYSSGIMTISSTDTVSSASPLRISGGSNSSFSEPLHVFDVNGDGKKEVIVDDYMYGASIYDAGGTLITRLGNSYAHSVTTDVDGDGQPDIALPLPAVNQFAVCTVNGTVKKGYPIKIYDALRSWILAEDLDGNGVQTILFAGQHHLYAFNGDGSMRPGFPVFVNEIIDDTYPAVADINSDGILDIVFTATGSTTQAQYESFQGPLNVIYVVNSNGKLITPWPVSVNPNYPFPFSITNTASGKTVERTFRVAGRFASPLIASVDGDNSPEIIFTSSNGFLYLFSAEGKPREGYPIYLACRSAETGVLGDFDKDGSLNFVFHSFPDSVYENGRILCLDFGPGSYNPQCIPWPMLQQNPERTGISPKPFSGSRVENAGDGTTHQPVAFALDQNYPNPFNPSTSIRYALPSPSKVRLEILNTLGQRVALLADNVEQNAGYHSEVWNSNTASGVYFYRMEAVSTDGTVRHFVETRKMILLR